MTDAAAVGGLMRRALAHHQAGKLAEAGAIYQQVLLLDPGHAEALHYLGAIAYANGQVEAAIELMARAIATAPSNSVFFLNFGTVLEAHGEADRAMACYRRAIELDPRACAAHLNLGNALLGKGLYAEAAANFGKALAIAPENPEVINSLGVALEKMGQLERAVVCYRKATALRPEYAEAYANLGNPLAALGRTEEAIASFSQAIRLNPQLAAAYGNLGNVLYRASRAAEAIESCEKAVALAPNVADFQLGLGNAYRCYGQLGKANACYQRVIEFDGSNAGAYRNLGLTLMDLGMIAEAERSLLRALELKPGFAVAYSNLLFLHASMRDITPEAERALAAGWEKCALSEAERTAARQRSSAASGVFAALPRAGRRLRIGVVSAELGIHAVAEFLEPFLEHLDKPRFHLTLFPTEARSDSRSQRLHALADHSVSLVGIAHLQAAERIRAEKIDILMDTTGHTNNCHLAIFAHRAAPVQLTYAGYWSTTGLTEMDWFLADPDMPVSFDRHFTEGLWRLPRLASCYRGDPALPESHWEPGETIWVGSFNRYHKIREETLALWAKVLRALPEAKLLLEDRAENEDETHERILSNLAALGVAANRVEFVPAVPGHERHMVLYDRLDVALDTIPFNSGTTAFDALWMGAPLVALEGSWSGGRIASSALRALGRSEWIAHSDDEYVSIVSELARNVERRKALRSTQRAMMAASPLCDAKGLSAAFQEAFEAMYDRWLAS